MNIPWLSEASKSRRYLVGVSGGADSVAMLHLLLAAGFRKLVVCHLNHQLRGRESTADARFVERLAKLHKLDCEIGRSDVKRRMKQSGESMETAARHARHDFFSECAKRHRCSRVLLAHHADDQAETILWNLLRGSHGLKGMRGEQEILVGRKRLELIRPLLGVRHADLVEWLSEQQLPWREDETNAQAVAVRNRLRNEVFPLLDEISGRDAVGAMVRLESDLADWKAAEEQWVVDAKLLDPQGRLHLPALRKLAPNLQRVAIREFLADGGIGSLDRALLDSAMSLLDVSNPASINLPGGGKLRRREGRLFVEL